MVGVQPVDAGDLAVAPLVGPRPSGVLVDRTPRTVRHRAVFAQLLLDGLELCVGRVAGGDEIAVGASGVGAELAESAGLGDPVVEVAELVPEPPRFLFPALDDAGEAGVEGRAVRWRLGQGGLVLGAFRPEPAVEVPGVIGGREASLRDPGHCGEDSVGGVAGVDDDVAVFLAARLWCGVPGVGGLPASALGDVGAQPIKVGGGEEVGLFPGAAWAPSIVLAHPCDMFGVPSIR